VDSVNANGGEKVLITSKAGRRQNNHASREAGSDLHQVMDGCHWFEDTGILVMDEDANGHPVLGFGKAGTTTSFYCCAFGDELVTGLQGPFEGRYGISVRDFGEVQDAPVFRTRVDWYVGFAVRIEPPPSCKAYGQFDPARRTLWIAPITAELGIARPPPPAALNPMVLPDAMAIYGRSFGHLSFPRATDGSGGGGSGAGGGAGSSRLATGVLWPRRS
jgi:hypothetical protein